MRCALIFTTLLVSACGSFNQAMSLRDKAIKDHQAGRHADCIEKSDQAVALYTTSLGEGDAFQQKSQRPFILQNLGTAYHYRAHCHKTLGHQPEAVADLDLAAKTYADSCGKETFMSKPGFEKVSWVCQQAANDMELLAKWKKDLASGGTP